MPGRAPGPWRQRLNSVSTMPWVFFCVEFFVLFLSSRFLFKSFFALIYFVFHSQKVAVFLLSVFFFPGVFIHEIAHLLMASLLRVGTHGIEFMPELKGNSLKMGSVKVEQSDILRSLLIGVAPIIMGSLIISASMFVLSKIFSYAQIFSSPLSFAMALFVGYVIFVIANTMFSSKKDVEGAVELLFAVVLLGGVLYLAGFSPHEWIFVMLMKSQVTDFVAQVAWLLAIPVGINMVVVLGAYPLLKKLQIV